jgi:Tol biopolymer transport system component
MRQIKTKIKIKALFVGIFVVLAFTAMGTEIFSQYQWFYGKNKVPLEKYRWQYVETPNFDIYYYTSNEAVIKKISKASEDAYKRISEYLNVKVEKRIPLIFYSTKIDFLQTNIAGYVPWSALAFAEPTAYRVVIQGDAPFDELVHVITHELGHIFEYEILGKTAMYISPPLWVLEGFSDFIAGGWDQFGLLIVRDGVLNGRVPEMQKNGDLASQYYPQGSRTVPYDFGHMVYEFLDDKIGKRGIKKLINSLRGGPLARVSAGGRNILKAIDYTPKLFNFEFGKYLRNRFKKFESRENPEDYSYIIGPDFPYAYSFSHQVSPSGEMLAILTVDAREGTVKIILISMKDGKVIKKLTPGFTGKYDFINLKFNPTEGTSFTWNKKSDQVAFFAVKGFTNYLVIVDVLTGNIVKRVKIKNIQDPSSPTFHPTENKLYFTGQETTRSYLFSMDLDTNKIVKHTEGILFIKAIDIAPGGKRIVFSAKADKYYKLYLGTLDNPEMARQITSGSFNDITPAFSDDGRYVYYSSDERESYNINAIDLQEKMLYRYTDVKTGNFFPVKIPGETDKVVMSSYYKGTFLLFKKDISVPLEKREIEFEDIDKEELAKAEIEAKDLTGLDIQFKGSYKPFSRLYVKSLPPISIALGTDGGLFGYTYLTLTDLMGDHDLTFYLSTFYGYRSYHLMYVNQKNRLQLFSHLFYFQDAYYYSGFIGSSYLTTRKMFGGEGGFFYPFNTYYRAEATLSFYKQEENFDTLFYGQELPYGQFFNGWAMPLRVSLVGETTLFANYGPNTGHTFKLTFEKFFKLGSEFLDAYVVQGDFRKYFRLDNYSLFAFRLYGFKSGGENPLLFWTGGNNTLRAVGFRQITGSNLFLFNAEFRFPLIHLAATPIGIIGPIRGVFFFDLGGIWFNGQDFRIFEEGKFRLQDAISSYGFGLQFFFLGYPMHVEWVWRTDLQKRSYYGVNFWIGFDF